MIKIHVTFFYIVDKSVLLPFDFDPIIGGSSTYNFQLYLPLKGSEFIIKCKKVDEIHINSFYVFPPIYWLIKL